MRHTNDAAGRAVGSVSSGRDTQPSSAAMRGVELVWLQHVAQVRTARGIGEERALQLACGERRAHRHGEQKMAALVFVAGLLTVAAVEDMLEEAHDARQDTRRSVIAFIADFALFTLVAAGLETMIGGGGSAP